MQLGRTLTYETVLRLHLVYGTTFLQIFLQNGWRNFGLWPTTVFIDDVEIDLDRLRVSHEKEREREKFS